MGSTAPEPWFSGAAVLEEMTVAVEQRRTVEERHVAVSPSSAVRGPSGVSETPQGLVYRSWACPPADQGGAQQIVLQCLHA